MSTGKQHENDDDEPRVHRDRHEHGGASTHPDDDELARRTERERVDAGLEAYDPDDVPDATDVTPDYDPSASEEFQELEGEVARQIAKGELRPLTKQHPFPPSHYDE
jgi:hypothetical protein